MIVSLKFDRNTWTMQLTEEDMNLSQSPIVQKSWKHCKQVRFPFVFYTGRVLCGIIRFFLFGKWEEWYALTTTEVAHVWHPTVWK